MQANGREDLPLRKTFSSSSAGGVILYGDERKEKLAADNNRTGVFRFPTYKLAILIEITEDLVNPNIGTVMVVCNFYSQTYAVCPLVPFLSEMLKTYANKMR
jgi:hypothetical protein